MSKKIKYIFTIVAVGLSMVITIPANAAQMTGFTEKVTSIKCSDCNGYVTNPESIIYCHSNDDYSHDVMRLDIFTCRKGNKTDVISILATETHTFDHNRWDSIMHNSSGIAGASHTYRIYCTDCGYSRVITIPCSYGQLKYHSTPF